MPTYSADQIVGKTLIAKKPVALKRLPAKSAPTVYTVPTGGTVGVVYSWIQRDGLLWWMFYDSNQKTYYAQQQPNTYDMGALGAQGVESLEQVQEDEEKAESPVSYYLEKYLKPIMWAGVAYFAWKAFNDTKR